MFARIAIAKKYSNVHEPLHEQLILPRAHRHHPSPPDP